MPPTKSAVIAALRAALDEELSAVERVAAMARDEVSSEQTKQEGKYDTRATEASYLARGQAWRIAELRQLSAWFGISDFGQPLDPPVVQVGALIELEGPRSQLVFMAPTGGLRAEVEGVPVLVISPGSPLGIAMEELEEGDSFELDSPTGIVEYTIRRLE